VRRFGAGQRLPRESSHERQVPPCSSAKRRPVIRVAVPLDVGTIAATRSEAFALATPLRVEELLKLAVYEALGSRAPQDKRERGLRATLAGLRAGRFVVDVDGRLFGRVDDVVLCSGTATLRFFSTEVRHSLPLP